MGFSKRTYGRLELHHKFNSCIYIVIVSAKKSRISNNSSTVKCAEKIINQRLFFNTWLFHRRVSGGIKYPSQTNSCCGKKRNVSSMNLIHSLKPSELFKSKYV